MRLWESYNSRTHNPRYVRTEEIRNKNRDALKGKPSSNQWTKESKDKFIRTRLGMPLKSGEHIYGFVKIHKYLTKDQFDLLLCAVRQRDGNKCILCGENSSEKLIEHRVVPSKIGKDFRLCDSKSNLVTLCRHCHPTVHGGRKTKSCAWKSFLPFAKEYLSQFRYKKLLLDKFI